MTHQTRDSDSYTTGNGWVSTADTTFCPKCQRERVSCAHLAAETEGSR